MKGYVYLSTVVPVVATRKVSSKMINQIVNNPLNESCVYKTEDNKRPNETLNHKKVSQSAPLWFTKIKYLV